MSQEEFDALMPHEFWREWWTVWLRRCGTLLLAEAFWLLEGISCARWDAPVYNSRS